MIWVGVKFNNRELQNCSNLYYQLLICHIEREKNDNLIRSDKKLPKMLTISRKLLKCEFIYYYFQ